MSEFLVRILRGNSARPTRLHTERGQLASLDSLVKAAVRRAEEVFLHKVPVAPWMAPQSIERLAQLLQPQHRLLEFGSGRSTAWYAARVKEVVSIEPNATWAEKVRGDLLHAGLLNCVLVESTIKDVIPDVSQHGQFDVVIVDGDDEWDGGSRMDCVAAAKELGASIVVLDDSDRAWYREAAQVLDAYRQERFVGFRSRPFVAGETSVYIRSDVGGHN